MDARDPMSGASTRPFRIGVAVAMLLTLLLPGGMTAASTIDAAAAVGPDAAVTTSWIVTVKPGRGPVERTGARTMARTAGGRAGRIYSHALKGFVFTGSARAAAALRRDPSIRSVVPNGTIHLLADSIPTGVARIRANHPTQPSAASLGF
jgi:hypothetical protein